MPGKFVNLLMSDDDSKFLGEVIDRIGFVLITAEVMQRDDEHYPKKKLEKNRQKKYYYLSATIYYFDEIVSEEKRNKIIDQELSYENYEPPKPGKKIGRKSSGFMIILNSLLALVSIGFAVYCYFHGWKLVRSREFAGSSHDKISEEVYRR